MNKDEMHEQPDQNRPDKVSSESALADTVTSDSESSNIVASESVMSDTTLSESVSTDIMSGESALSDSNPSASLRGKKLQNIFNLFRQNSLATAIVAIIIITSLTVGLLNIFNGNNPVVAPADDTKDSVIFNVKADKETTAGISLDTGFKITTNRNLSADEMKAFIKLTPTSEFTLKKLKAGSYHLSAPKFGTGKLVTIALIDESGTVLKSAAFQTEQEFGVESAFPRDKCDYVELNTGIEIKLTYPDVEASEFAKYFTISPTIKGSFEKHNATIVFVPSATLTEATIYTVKVKEGLSSQMGGALKKDYSFSFKTISINNCEITGELTETFLPDENPVVEVYTATGDLNDYSAEIYRFPTVESYKTMLSTYILKQNLNTEYIEYVEKLPTVGLDVYTNYSGKFINIRSEYEIDYGYAIFPDKLPTGWYLVNIKLTTKSGVKHEVQKLIQISPISVYSLSATENVSFWINDTRNGKPIENAVINVEGTKMNGITGSDGIVTIAKPKSPQNIESNDQNDPYRILTVKSGDNIFVDISSKSGGEITYSYGESHIQDQFYAVIYSDRTAYLPTDTVRVWGVVKARDGKTAAPDGLTVNLSTYKIPVTVESDGSFLAEIKLKAAISGGDYLTLNIDNEVITYRYITFLDYIKPAYLLEATTDSWFYTDTDKPIQLSVQGNFYDGTPISGLRVVANCNDTIFEKGSYPAQLDESGSAKIAIKYDDTGKKEKTWYPTYEFIDVMSNELENTYEFSANKSLMIFDRDIMLESNTKTIAGKTILNISTNMITTSRLKQSDEDIWSIDLIRGNPVDVDITLTAQKHYYQKIDLGTYYDYVRKVSSHRFKYEERTETPQIFRVKTSGGKLIFNKLKELDDDGFYTITMKYADSKGRLVQEESSIGSGIYVENQGGKNYSFGSGWTSTFKLSDNPKQFTLKVNDINAARTNNDNIMLVFNKNSIFSTSVIKGTTITVKPDEKMIPGCRLGGAYFDGKHVFNVRGMDLDYDNSERELDVQIETDKTVYSTKEKATIIIKASRNGNPVAGASVLVSIVDESALSVDDNSFIFREELYRYSYYESYGYASYVYHDMNDIIHAAEGMGEGESGGVRKDFYDTALFVRVKTDANGYAKTEIEMPDNLTNWKITALCYDKNMNVGQDQANVKVKRDFFVSPIISKKFVYGDDVVFSARSYGLLAQNKDVAYTFTLSGGRNNEKKITGRAKANTSVDFGKLPVGEYRIKILAKLGENSDGVELPFTVRNSNIEIALNKTMDLKKGIDISSTRFPVTIGFYNTDNIFVNQLLDDLVFASPIRADEKAAKLFGHDYIVRMTGKKPEYSKEIKEIITGFTDSYSFSDYSQSSDDPVLSARIAAAIPQYLSSDTISYFYNVVSSSESNSGQVAAAYMALAALKEPVLNDLRYLVDKSYISSYDRLYIIAGLALIGDSENAKVAYDKYIKPNLKSTIDENGYTIWSYTSEEGISYINFSSIALMTSAVLGSTESEGLVRYLVTQNRKEELYYCEYMVYLKYKRISHTNDHAIFTYNRSGKSEQVALDGRNPVFLDFDKESLANADFKVESGNITACAYFYGEPFAPETNKNFKISKSFNQNQTNFTLGETVEITVKITKSLSINSYQSFYIDDCLPTGFRFIGVDNVNYIWQSGIIGREGQNLRFWIEMPRGYISGALTYKAKAVLPGEYVLESAYTTGINSDMLRTPRGKVVINAGK